MENASKALIIAGAILLSILLITLGIMVMRNAQGTIDDANLDAETAQVFNNKISQFCGVGKTASDMNSLMDTIAGVNGAQKSLVAAKQHYVNIVLLSFILEKVLCFLIICYHWNKRLKTSMISYIHLLSLVL